jgi:uncharacterized protein (DUF58 family)
MSKLTKIFELVFIIAIGVLVTLYVSAPVGFTILLMVGVGVLFSFLVTLATALLKSVKVTASVSRTTLYKTETTILKITVKNKTILPVADVRIKLLKPAFGMFADTEKDMVRFTVAGRSEETFEIIYHADVWGQYRLGAQTVRLGDFLGIFSLPWQMSGQGDFEVCVFPNVLDIPPENEIIGNALEILYDDESEETTETTNLFGGFPGYNHRDYEPGDPIKRINWKLSAKRDKLLLRLDDEVETSEIDICLMGYDSYRKRQEEAVETALGLALLFLKLEIKVNVHFFIETESIFRCNTAADVEDLRSEFLRYYFTENGYEPEGLSYYIKVSPGNAPELVKS